MVIHPTFDWRCEMIWVFMPAKKFSWYYYHYHSWKKYKNQFCVWTNTLWYHHFTVINDKQCLTICILSDLPILFRIKACLYVSTFHNLIDRSALCFLICQKKNSLKHVFMCILTFHNLINHSVLCFLIYQYS